MTRGKDQQRAAGKSAGAGQVLGSKWRKWLLAALLVAALAVAVLHWGDVQKFADLLSKAKLSWLGAAALLQLATYFGLSAQWWLTLRKGGTPRRQGQLFRLTFAKHFADQVVPTAGVSGNLVLVDRLVRLGVPRSNAVAALLLQVVAYYFSYAIGAVGLLVLFWWKSSGLFLAGVVLAFLLMAAGIAGLTLWLNRKGQERLPGWIARWSKFRDFLELVGEAPAGLVRDPQLIAWLTLLNLLVFLADAATMQACLLALGATAPIAAGFAAFLMASIAAIVGPLPMGLGSFEAVSIAMLRLFGVPFEAALSATLLFRGFTLWLPLIPGGLLLRRELKPRKR